MAKFCKWDIADNRYTGINNINQIYFLYLLDKGTNKGKQIRLKFSFYL